MKQAGKISVLLLFFAFSVFSISGLILPRLNKALGGNSGAIWTTTGSCGAPQNANHYKIGETIFINGDQFDANTTHGWTIVGQPGGASCDPRITVAQNPPDILTDTNGAFCIEAYTVLDGDCGEYTVDVVGASKNDNYRVDDPTVTPTPTSIPTIAPTATPTSQPTSTPNPTTTITNTPTPTNASTPTPTSTTEPTPTSIPTIAPTATPTSQPTNTPNPTATPTNSPNQNPTPTPTPNNNGQILGTTTTTKSTSNGDVLGTSTDTLGATNSDNLNLRLFLAVLMSFISLTIGTNFVRRYVYKSF